MASNVPLILDDTSLSDPSAVGEMLDRVVNGPGNSSSRSLLTVMLTTGESPAVLSQRANQTVVLRAAQGGV
jgi:hypothetical protein